MPKFSNEKQTNNRVSQINRVRKESKDSQEAFNLARNLEKQWCDHKSDQGPTLVKYLDYQRRHMGNNGLYVNLNQPTASEEDMSKWVVCTQCGAIINLEIYSQERLRAAVFDIVSVINQMKCLGNTATLSDEEYKALVNMSSFVETDLANNLLPYYERVMKNLAGGNEQRRPNNASRVGHIGVAGPSRNSFR